MMVLDAYKALETLKEHPMINKDIVAITGWSLGGGVALFSGWEPLFRKINPKKTYLTHISHKLGFHKKVQSELPKDVYLSFDRLELFLD